MPCNQSDFSWGHNPMLMCFRAARPAVWPTDWLAGQGFEFPHLWKEVVKWFRVTLGTSCLRLKDSTKDLHRLSVDFKTFNNLGTKLMQCPPQARRGIGHLKEFRKCRMKANWDDPGGLPLSCLTPFAPAEIIWTLMSLRWKSDSQRGHICSQTDQDVCGCPFLENYFCLILTSRRN